MKRREELKNWLWTLKKMFNVKEECSEGNKTAVTLVDCSGTNQRRQTSCTRPVSYTRTQGQRKR